MAGKKKATIPDAVPVMSNTRRRSSARKNKAFQMLQRDMEQVTCGRKIYGQKTMPVSSFIRAGSDLDLQGSDCSEKSASDSHFHETLCL